MSISVRSQQVTESIVDHRLRDGQPRQQHRAKSKSEDQDERAREHFTACPPLVTTNQWGPKMRWMRPSAERGYLCVGSRHSRTYLGARPLGCFMENMAP